MVIVNACAWENPWSISPHSWSRWLAVEKQVSKCKQNCAVKCEAAYVRSQTCLFDVLFVIVGGRWKAYGADERSESSREAGKVNTPPPLPRPCPHVIAYLGYFTVLDVIACRVIEVQSH